MSETDLVSTKSFLLGRLRTSILSIVVNFVEHSKFRPSFVDEEKKYEGAV